MYGTIFTTNYTKKQISNETTTTKIKDKIYHDISNYKRISKLLDSHEFRLKTINRYYKLKQGKGL